MTSRIRVVITLILVLSIQSVWAQAPARFTLKEAQDYGVANNVQVKSAQLDVRSAETTVDERLSTGLPQLNASIDYQNFFKLPTSLLPAEFFGGEAGEFIPVQFGTEQNVTAGLSASQLLFNGAWFVALNASKIYVNMVEAQQTVAESDVKKNVESAYYSVLIAKEFEGLLQKNIENLDKVYFEVSEMNKQGFVEEIDVDRLKISKSTLNGQLENAKRQTELAKSYLKFSMGMDMNSDIELTDTLGGMLNGNFNVIDNDQNFLTRPEFQIMQTLVTLNEYNVKVNRSAYLPTLALYASFSENAQRNEFDFFDSEGDWFQTGLVGVKMDIPIFSGFYRKSTLQNAQIGLEHAQLNQQNATQGILMEIENARITYLNAENDLATQQENIDLAQKIYNTTLIKYKAGVGSSIELTSAESTLYQTQGSYISALFNLLTAKTNLTKSLGYY